MPIKREYKCQIIFQTAANVTQIAKKINLKKETKHKANKSYSNKSSPNCGPQDCMEEKEKKEKQQFLGNMLFIGKAKFPFLAGFVTYTSFVSVNKMPQFSNRFSIKNLFNDFSDHPDNRLRSWEIFKATIKY